MPNGNDNQVNPYEYLTEFSSDYDTSDAFRDIGYPLKDTFLDTKDPTTGLTYRDLIPEYDPYEEERMRTEFSQGAKSMYQSTVGELAGITSQTRQQRAVSGFAGGGEMQRIEEESRGDLQGQYGDAFQGALLDLVSGIRGQRMQYQDDLAGLLQSFGSLAFAASGNAWSDYNGAPNQPPSGYSGENPMEGYQQKGTDGQNYIWNGGRWVLYEEGGVIDPGSGGLPDPDPGDESGLDTGDDSSETSSVPTEYAGDTITVGGAIYVWNNDTQQYELEF